MGQLVECVLSMQEGGPGASRGTSETSAGTLCYPNTRVGRGKGRISRSSPTTVDFEAGLGYEILASRQAKKKILVHREQHIVYRLMRTTAHSSECVFPFEHRQRSSWE